MKINLRLFAVARELAGAPELALELPESATVADVRRELLARFPQLSGFGSSLRFSVDAEYADDGTSITPTSQVACIPPTSGG
jgi:molybdopterin converting factor subunit 1